MGAPMTLAKSRQLDLNAEIDALVSRGDSAALGDVGPDVVFECARRYLAAQINSRSRQSVRGREQFEKVREESRAVTASWVRTVVEKLAADLAGEWSELLLAERFVLPGGGQVSWAEATVEQHEARALFLEGLASGNVETAAIHRRAVRDCLDARVESLAGIR
jgi:hypothetical protein